MVKNLSESGQTTENIAEINHLNENKNSGHFKYENHILPNTVRSKKQQQDSTVDVWTGFKEYLKNENQSTSSIKNKICYAKRFYYILDSMNVQDLTKQSPDVKAHAMKALASLSKGTKNNSIF